MSGCSLHSEIHYEEVNFTGDTYLCTPNHSMLEWVFTKSGFALSREYGRGKASSPKMRISLGLRGCSSAVCAVRSSSECSSLEWAGLGEAAGARTACVSGAEQHSQHTSAGQNSMQSVGS